MKNIAIQSKNIIFHNDTNNTKRKVWLMAFIGSGLVWALITLMVWIIFSWWQATRWIFSIKPIVH